jgi:hypothetical protein
MLHKIQKTMMLETDVPETINEAIMSVKKMGRVGIIAAYVPRFTLLGILELTSWRTSYPQIRRLR